MVIFHYRSQDRYVVNTISPSCVFIIDWCNFSIVRFSFSEPCGITTQKVQKEVLNTFGIFSVFSDGLFKSGAILKIKS